MCICKNEKSVIIKKFMNYEFIILVIIKILGFM